MFCWITRLLLLVYLALPFIAIGLVIVTMQQIQVDVEPVITSATNSINAATAALDNELRSLGRNFQPLVDTVNALRSGMNTIASFISGAINVMVDAVNGLTFNSFRISRFQGITIPPLVDLSFIERISTNITEIGTQVTSITSTVTNTVSLRLQTLILALVLLVVWGILGFALIGLTMFLTLWRRRS